MSDLHRYHRQMLLRGFGEQAQRRLEASSVLLIGCGALGTVIAESLVRAGVGHLRLVDRDLVELTNLQRQTLFTESDARDAAPKAVAAARRLALVNSAVRIEPVVADFTPRTAHRLAEGAQLLIDGTDNFQTRYILNDLAVERTLPYVYGGAVGTAGLAYVVLPHSPTGESAWERAGIAGPCLRCVFGDQPSAGGPTCDTVGVLGPLTGIVANIQAAEALKLLTGNHAAVNRGMISLDLWDSTWRRVEVAAAYEPGSCACCGRRRFDYLHDARAASAAVTLCGRNAVQIASESPLDLPAVAHRLAAHAPVKRNDHLLRAEITERGRDYQITLFTDGRAIIHGTDDPAVARTLYARYIGA